MRRVPLVAYNDFSHIAGSGGGGSDSGGGGGGGSCGGAQQEGGGGGGAGGGEGQILSTSGDLASSQGGNGGPGGSGVSGPRPSGGGGGGGGGSGAAVGNGVNAHVPTSILVQGGSAGGGGSPGPGGDGFGGIGVSLGDGATLANDGSISGGTSGVTGQGGAGVAGSNIAVALNAGSSVSGGLGGANRANAITFVSGANTLTLNGGSLTGNIAVEAGTLTFNQSGTQTLANTITGAGAVIYNFTGALIVGMVNTYSGGTTISAGTLLVSNVSGTSATGSGPVAVSGGNLVGNGAVSGAVNLSSGVVLPGSAVNSNSCDAAQNSLSVGTYTQTGGQLNIYATGSGCSTHLSVTGNARLGGTLQMNISPAPSPGQNFTVLNATGVVSGAFSTISASGLAAGQSLALTYNPTSVVATVVGPPTHFAVTAMTPVTSGVNNANGLSVTALDAGNQTVAGYSGTVHFTSTDAGAVLSADSVLSSGTGTFSFALKQAGPQAITATDTATSSIAGTSNPIQVSPGATARFVVAAPANAIPGTPFNFSVTATDLYGNVTPAYAGTAHFTSSDGAATLPVNYTFVAGNAGVQAFSATLQTVGNQSIAAGDTAAASISGSGSIAVGKLSQSITFGAAPTIFVNGSGTVTATTTATPGASYPITFSTTSSSACSVTGAGAVAGISAGSNNCVITATQAGDNAALMRVRRKRRR